MVKKAAEVEEENVEEERRVEQWALSYIWSENFSHLAFRKVKPKMAEIEAAIRRQSQSSTRS